MEFLRATMDPNEQVPFPPQPFGITISEILVVENSAQNYQPHDLLYAVNDESDASFLLIALQQIEKFSKEKKLKFHMEVNRILKELKEL